MYSAIRMTAPLESVTPVRVASRRMPPTPSREPAMPSDPTSRMGRRPKWSTMRSPTTTVMSFHAFRMMEASMADTGDRPAPPLPRMVDE